MEMRSIGLGGICVLVLSAQVAAAKVSCRAVDWVSDLRSLVSATAPREKYRARVEELLSGTDTDLVLDGFNQTLHPTYFDAVERLVESAQRISAGEDSVMSVSDARRVDVAIKRLSCAEDQTALAANAFDTASGKGARGSRSSSVFSEESPLLLVIGTLTLLPISLVFVSTAILRRSMRRSRRYPCQVPVSLGDGQPESVTVDISQTGCKIETAKRYEVDDPVDLSLGGVRASGTVRWQKGKRVGIRFDAPMRGSHLKYLLHKSRSIKSGKRKKGAASRPRPSE